jgi:hypothetical protein
MRKMKAYRLLVGKPEGKRPLERTIRRWVGNIKTDLGEIGRGCVNYTIGQPHRIVRRNKDLENKQYRSAALSIISQAFNEVWNTEHL